MTTAAIPPKKILVIDDEASVRDSLKLLLSRLYEVEVAESGPAAMELLSDLAASPDNRLPDLILLDLMIPGVEGLGLLENIKSAQPATPVIMLTATKTVKTA